MSLENVKNQTNDKEWHDNTIYHRKITSLTNIFISNSFSYVLLEFTHSISHPIVKKQWDGFVEFVYQRLQKHPSRRPDAVMAILLGSSIRSHYMNWSYQIPAKPLEVRIAYLLNYWRAKSHYHSMKDLLTDFDEKLKSQKSFDSMREEIKQHFLWFI